MEQRGDQRHHPDQRPALVLAVAGRCRALLEADPEPGQLLVRQLRIRARGPFGGQSWCAAGNPNPPPLIRRLRRHFQLLRDLDRRHISLEQRGRALPHQLPPHAFYLVNTTAIAISHTTSRPDTSHIRRSPKSLTVDSSETPTPKGV